MTTVQLCFFVIAVNAVVLGVLLVPVLLPLGWLIHKSRRNRRY